MESASDSYSILNSVKKAPDKAVKNTQKLLEYLLRKHGETVFVSSQKRFHIARNLTRKQPPTTSCYTPFRRYGSRTDFAPRATHNEHYYGMPWGQNQYGCRICETEYGGHATKYSTSILATFPSGFHSHPAILKAEKALGTSLDILPHL